MIRKKLSTWWRSYPQKKRVKIIASVLLIFAGSEALILAPVIFDIALMIDIGGLAFVLTVLRASVSASMIQIRSIAAGFLKPVMLVIKVGEIMSDWGSDFPLKWHRQYFLIDRLTIRFAAAFLVVGVSLFATRALIAIA